MSSSSRRTTRRLLKLASLGLAGLIAGLLSIGCSSSSSKAANVQAAPPISSNVEFTPSDTSASQNSDLPQSIESREIPALHHPPSARRLEYGSARTTAQPVALNSRTGS
jgi:hypothetical protein